MATSGENLSFSDFVSVAPGLFFGAHPEGEDPFDLGPTVVVCLSARPSSGEAPAGRMYVHWSIKDGPVPETAGLDGLATMIASWLSRGVGVFIHCDAGMNRSALVTARVLIQQGMAPEDAISRVRERRPGALGEEYAQYLRSLPIPGVAVEHQNDQWGGLFVDHGDDLHTPRRGRSGM